MHICFAGPERHPAHDKLGWAREAAERLGHATSRATTPQQAADSTARLVILEQAGACWNAAEVEEAAQRRHGAWVGWYYDLLDRGQGYDTPRVRELAAVWRHLDAVGLKEPRAFATLRERGALPIYLDQACPSQMAEREWRGGNYDAIIFGNTGYARRRTAAARMAQAGLRVAWAGHATGERPIDGVDYLGRYTPLEIPWIAAAGTVAVSIDLREETGYTSDRLHLLTGAGCCVVDTGRTPAAGQQRATEDTLVETVQRLAGNPQEAEKIGRAAREKTYAKNLYEHRIRRLVHLCSTCAL